MPKNTSDSRSNALGQEKQGELATRMNETPSFWNYGLPINFWVKLGLAIIFDSLDLMIGIFGSIFGLPGLSLAGTGWDLAIQWPIAFALAGKYGAVGGAIEVGLITDAGNIIDAFIPMITIGVVLAEFNNPSGKFAVWCDKSNACSSIFRKE